MTKLAAVVVLKHPTKPLYLAVRKHGTEDWGFPGGKCNEREGTYFAARRELKEETAVELREDQKEQLRFIFFTQENDFMVYAWEFIHRRSEDDIVFKGSAEGETNWATREQLEAGRYGAYNQKLFAKLGIR